MKLLQRLHVALSGTDSAPTSTPPRKAKRKVRLTSVEARPAVLSEFRQAARERGYKSITVSVLLARFGYQKRSEANLRLITDTLAAHSLTIYPSLTRVRKLSQSVRIYSFPVEQLGDLFEDPATAATAAVRQQRERALEDCIERHDLFAHFGLTKHCRQYSPRHTQDRFDFLCHDAQGTAVVLELKHADGGKSAVEQVLRYLGMLRQEDPARPARGILVTGVRDVDTAKALYGMTSAQQQLIEWYLYCYNRSTGSLTFQRVPYEDIAHHLHRAWQSDG